MDQENKNNEGIDLGGMLKESGQGSDFQKRQGSYYPFQPKIIQLVIKYSGGLVKTPKQASYVLIGFFILAVIIFSIIVFGNGNERPSGPPTPLQEDKL